MTEQILWWLCAALVAAAVWMHMQMRPKRLRSRRTPVTLSSGEYVFHMLGIGLIAFLASRWLFG
jgi:hypothetical protein